VVAQLVGHIMLHSIASLIRQQSPAAAKLANNKKLMQTALYLADLPLFNEA